MSGNQKKKDYKCVFFDLDHTLWDYETNSKETLHELYEDYNLREQGVPDREGFCRQFRTVNLALWDLYDRDLVNHDYIRAERFKQILGHFGTVNEKLSAELSVDYLERCPKKGNLMPHAVDVLNYLSPRYKLTIVTNGFEEIQNVKLASGKIEKYFHHIITSQKAGHRKPSKNIFDYAMVANAVQCCDVIMIGDNLVTDIGGARESSIDSVFFNPEKISHNENIFHEISCLSELKNIL
jgi:YjjG family noncanonical pyrimidine nucleotidase